MDFYVEYVFIEPQALWTAAPLRRFLFSVGVSIIG
jgi:hypothetical protein